MSEPSGSAEPSPENRAIRNALTGFTVIDRNDKPVGVVKRVNVEAGCLLVDTFRSLFSRREQHAVNLGAIEAIDVERFRVILTASSDEVATAPEFELLNPESHRAIARHYNGGVLPPTQ